MHQAPDRSIKWRPKEIVHEYYLHHEWDPVTTDKEILDTLQNNGQLPATPYDSKSVSHYPINGGLTENGVEVEWNSELSPDNGKSLKEWYPFDPNGSEMSKTKGADELESN